MGEKDVHDAVVPVGVGGGDEDGVKLSFPRDSVLDLVFPINPAPFFEGIMTFEDRTVGQGKISCVNALIQGIFQVRLD